VAVFNGLKTPKVVHIEKPQYPPAAKKTGIEGVVIVEATVTAEASVEKVKVAVFRVENRLAHRATMPRMNRL